jgi:DNA polymerase elongation subunit (family B)
LEQLIIRSQLKKPLYEYKAISPHVVAAKRMISQKKSIGQGELVSYYIAEGKGKLVRDKVRLPDEEGEYNIEYYLDKQILPAVESIFQIFDIDVQEVFNKNNQKSLLDF